ncbi:hypothetical protein WAE56_21005 [Iodobacter sp. LRB]|nr:hypothetical protein [Iodobacter sp. BJB302]
MKAVRYSDRQIMAILKQVEADLALTDMCRKHYMSNDFYELIILFPG